MTICSQSCKTGFWSCSDSPDELRRRCGDGGESRWGSLPGGRRIPGLGLGEVRLSSGDEVANRYCCIAAWKNDSWGVGWNGPPDPLANGWPGKPGGGGPAPIRLGGIIPSPAKAALRARNGDEAILSLSTSDSCSLFVFARRFWNQILTWVSVNFNWAENSALSAIERYCLCWNFFSSAASCWAVNGVLGFRFGLCFLRWHRSGPRGGFIGMSGKEWNKLYLIFNLWLNHYRY